MPLFLHISLFRHSVFVFNPLIYSTVFPLIAVGVSLGVTQLQGYGNDEWLVLVLSGLYWASVNNKIETYFSYFLHFKLPNSLLLLKLSTLFHVLSLVLGLRLFVCLVLKRNDKTQAVNLNKVEPLFNKPAS